MDPYKILGVEPSATQDEIKSAYRKLASKWHPDRNPDPEASDKLKEINAAYEMIKSADRRSTHDRTADHGFANASQSSAFNSDFIFNHFTNIFKQQSVKSFNIAIELTIEEIVTGKRITTTVNLDGEDIELDFAVPPGVPDGSRFNVKRLTSKTGFEVVINATVHTIQEKQRQRHGNDILIVEHISVFDAMLGTEIEIEPIAGTKLKMKIPAGTQPDTRLIMRNVGLPIFNQSVRGNIIAIIKIQIPKSLTQEQIDILEQFR